MLREHPLRIIRFSAKNLWLLMFPLLRHILPLLTMKEQFSPNQMVQWFDGIKYDLLVLFFILVFGWLQWYTRILSVKNQQIYVQEGVFLRRTRILPGMNISALTLEYRFWLKPVKGVYLYADTAGGLLSSTDIRLMIWEKDTKQFLSAMPKQRQGKRHIIRSHMGWRDIFLFSLLFSSSFSGSVLAATFWIRGGTILRDILEEFQITTRLEAVSEQVAEHIDGITPAAATLGILILLSWAASFVMNVMRYGRFILESDKRILTVRSGVFSKQFCTMRQDRICFLDIRQNLLTKFLGIFSLRISCPGFGKQKNAAPVCLPLLRSEELKQTLPMLFPGVKLQKNHIHPHLTAWWAFLQRPILFAVLLLPVLNWSVRQFPVIAEMLVFVRFMVFLPVLWKLLIQITALLTNGISVSKTHICLRYCRLFTFHTVIVEKDRIAKIRIQQNPIQRFFGSCTVHFYLQSETKHCCTLTSLRKSETDALLAANRRRAAGGETHL